MNTHYVAQVKEEIDKLLQVGFTYPIDKATRLSPIEIVLKKNKKLQVCIDYKKLNAAIISDPFPLPFTDELLDVVANHKMYSFLVGFSGYNQVRMALKDKGKTTFITKWEAFVMNFGLKNAPTTFQRMVTKIFVDFLQSFMRVIIDDFSVFGNKDKHLEHLKLCSKKYRES